MEPQVDYIAGARQATALRLRLLGNSFVPLPLYGKEPPIRGRNNSRGSLCGWSTLAVTPEMIEAWAIQWLDGTNTGIRTKNSPALDVDILSEPAADAIEGFVRKRYGDRGIILTRTGRYPKRAILFRTDEPFAKIAVSLKRPESDKAEKIEFLGDGQYLASFGIHPDTGQPYTWQGGEPGQIARDALPHISGEEAQQLVDDIIEILVHCFGYTLAPQHSKKEKTQDTQKEDTNPTADWQQLYDNIHEGRNRHDSLLSVPTHSDQLVRLIPISDSD
jgi:hypothetical protein